jgi:Domain of unknown function (DUF3597)
MGILANIFSKIFPSSHPANTAPTSATAGGSATGTTAEAAPAAVAPLPSVDVNQVLSEMASKNPEKLNWQTSIVDLMKLLGIDSSLAHRKELAAELHYSGDMNDSATMNIWLQKQVMQQVAANGGKVPAGLVG